MITYSTIKPAHGVLRRIGEGPGSDRHELPERLLWKLWKRRAARHQEFRTGAGGRIRVLYPGRHGTSAGPDFRDALLDVEGLGLVRGDVEIHRRQRDWDAHGHGDDPNYDGVVLHATLDVDEPETKLHSGAMAQVVPISPLLDDADECEVENPGSADVSSRLWKLLGGHRFPRPLDEQEAAGLLDRAGDERFRRKSGLLVRFASEQGPEQTMYEALLEGLGYKHNQQPFVRLAQTAPMAALRRAALPVLAQQRPMALRHWLLTAAGLNDGAPGPLPRGLGPPMERSEWHLFRVRPANHPAARIGGAAVLLDRFLEQGLLTGLGHACASPKQLTGALTVEGQEGGASPIGAGRAGDLAVNVVLPLLHGLEGAEESRFIGLYRTFPKLQDNEVVREMSGHLFPEDWSKVANTARRQQGLLHLAALLRGAW